MVVTIVLSLVVLDAVWIAYAMIKAPVIEEEEYTSRYNDVISKSSSRQN